MADGIKKEVKYESVRIRKDKKKRLLNVVLNRKLAEEKATEIGVLDEALEIGLPKLEKKLGL